jgi:hypothetical protein
VIEERDTRAGCALVYRTRSSHERFFTEVDHLKLADLLLVLMARPGSVLTSA